ncbi:unnamed protein product [Candidula unifasciata]|uniref:Uncharacterized protein n=1 Tax=Candidula unifasciata TaxID=100452 RepID=A0A8S3YXN2_9EUPU|nr:unnamed protein product [Candidula unifasciata]
MLNHVAPLNQLVILKLITLLVFGLRPVFSSCESRCEAANRDLVELRTIWSRSYTIVNGQDVSFEQFLLSLVQETDDPQAAAIRANVLLAVGRYQNCVMACENECYCFKLS